MPLLVLRFRAGFHTLLFRLDWLVLGIVLFALFFGSWVAMYYFEGSDASIVQSDTYWWFFSVTITTVGYGDFSPATLGGRISTTVVQWVGIGFAAAFAGKIAETFFSISRRRKQGKMATLAQNHIVIFGYHGTDTEDLVAELLGDDRWKKVDIVLCSNKVEDGENNPQGVKDFICGDLTSQSLLERANVREANRIIVYGATDDETFAISAAVTPLVREDAHIVAYFEYPEKARLLHGINPKIECVESLAASMLAQATQDPGATGVVKSLISNLDQDTYLRLNIPNAFSGKTFEELLGIFKKEYDVILIGVAISHIWDAFFDLNPERNYIVKGGMSIAYIGKERIDNKVNWEEL